MSFDVVGEAELVVAVGCAVTSAASLLVGFCVGVAALPPESIFQNCSRTSRMLSRTVTGRCVHLR